ncbi:MAG: shikimate kinase AroK [Pseudomonadota bacterium]
MKSSQNLFLIGPMGSGKSAVGRALAASLHRPFFDSDDVIEERTGVDIPFIFEKEGEAGFRLRESRIIAELSGREGIILATGGGAIVNDENRQHLGARGLVVYLRTSVEQQLNRTSKGRERPLLSQSSDRREVLDALMQEREPKYLEIADIVVVTDARKVRAVANEILEQLP